MQRQSSGSSSGKSPVKSRSRSGGGLLKSRGRVTRSSKYRKTLSSSKAFASAIIIVHIRFKSMYSMNRQWCPRERPLGKTPKGVSGVGLSKASFTWKDPSDPTRGSFQGSFPGTSLTVYTVCLRDWSRGAVYCTLAFTRPRVIPVASSICALESTLGRNYVKIREKRKNPNRKG